LLVWGGGGGGFGWGFCWAFTDKEASHNRRERIAVPKKDIYGRKTKRPRVTTGSRTPTKKIKGSLPEVEIIRGQGFRGTGVSATHSNATDTQNEKEREGDSETRPGYRKDERNGNHMVGCRFITDGGGQGQQPTKRGGSPQQRKIRKEG